MDHIPLQHSRGGDKRKRTWREGWGGGGGGWAIIRGKRLIEGRLLYSRKYGNQRAE